MASKTRDGDRRTRRRRAVNDYRRQIILAAARRVFAEQGLEGASMRAIATAAGYTHGALYFHYKSKEEIYGDLLGLSLDRLHAAVRAAAAKRTAPAQRLSAAALGFFAYYRRNPGDLDLGFYLFRGMRPLGLTPVLNAGLNGKLLAVLEEMARPLRALGTEPAAAQRETAALFAHAAGLLLLVHTGRMRLFRLDGRALMAEYVGRLVERCEPGPLPRASSRKGSGSYMSRTGSPRRTVPPRRTEA